MSVIFQTLKKIKQQQTDPQIPGAGKRVRSRKPAFREQLLRTPLAMGIVIGIIFLSGFLLLYGIDRLSSFSRDSSTPAYKAAAEKNTTHKSKPVENQNHTQELQAASETIAGEMTPPANFQPEDDRSLIDTSTSVTYSPPREASRPSMPSYVNLIEPSEEIAPRYSGPNQISAGIAAVNQPVGAAVEITSVQGQWKEDASASENKPKDEGFIAETEKIAGGKTESADRTATVITQPLDPEQRQRVANLEKFRRAAEKRAAITQLVKQLESAMDRMDAPEVEKMLSRLTAAKGEDNLYVMNLKAFWYLKQEFFSEAESLLLKILDADPDHLEAGLNLAVVEAKTRRLEAAQKRIKRLQELYPDNPPLADMVRKLRK